jgi:LAGLIDADG endonuclease/YopX protein
MKVINGRKTITTEIAYLAGFMDGEGCIRLKQSDRKGERFYVWVAVTNSYPTVLRRYKALFGGQIRKAERTPNKDIYHYLVTASEATDMLKVLVNFLDEKARQAHHAIWFHEHKDEMSGEERAAMAQKISDMKREVIGNIYENPELLK